MTDPQHALAINGCNALHELEAIVSQLALAVRAADLYLHNYDTSKPSRVRAETRAIVEEAMAVLRPQP